VQKGFLGGRKISARYLQEGGQLETDYAIDGRLKVQEIPKKDVPEQDSRNKIKPGVEF